MKATIDQRLQKLEKPYTEKAGQLPAVVDDDTIDAEIVRMRSSTGHVVMRLSEFVDLAV